MAKQHLLMLGLIVGGSLAFQACSSDSGSSKPATGNEAGAAGTVGEAGAGNEAGSIGAAGEAGSKGFVFPDALDPQNIVVPAAAPATSAHLLVAGTDFTTSTEVVSLTLAPIKVGDSTTFMDGDVAAVSSAGLGFALERTNDKVDLLDGGKVKTTFDITEPGTAGAASPANKAYVALLNQSLISILDLDAGTVSSRIDLSEFNYDGDSDHSADIGEGVYDATKKIVYYSLARIDRNAIAADPSFHLPCTKETGLIVGIDTTTDSVVDLNGAADGKAIELSLVSQLSLALSADGKSLIVLSSGCYEGATLKNQGVEVVDLAAGTTQAVYAPTGTDFLAKLILVGGSNAVLGSFDDLGAPHWNKLDLTAGKLGDELLHVPDAVTFDGKDLLGVDGTTGAVLRYDLSTGTATTISPTSWAGKYSAAASTALVK
jgi:hypothetical protein